MDSIGKIVLSLQNAAALSQLSIPTAEQVKGIIGASLNEAAHMLFPKINDSQKQQLIFHYKDQYLNQNNTPTPLYANTRQLLTGLKQQSKTLAVATGKARVGLEKVMAESNTKHFFTTTRTCDDAHSKPHPQMIEQILDELKVPASKALMIGDSYYDLEMARNAKVDSLGLTHGAANFQTLSKCKPKAIVHSMEELSKLVL